METGIHIDISSSSIDLAIMPHTDLQTVLGLTTSTNNIFFSKLVNTAHVNLYPVMYKNAQEIQS